MEQKKGKNQSIQGERKHRFSSLIIDGTKYRTFYNHKFENRKAFRMHDPNKLVSFIPGTVVKLVAKEGQEVHKGDTALILDAMKMKTRLVFERGGIVKAIHISEGEKVPKDFLMIELTSVPGLT